ncbi:MAG: protein kinase [Sedimentisphaerales bacterium]|nr:protein kinase [Sedimentisphaerales bacterium]
MRTRHKNEEQIFTAAIEIENRDQRNAYIAKSCGDDQNLLVAVQALLRQHDTNSFLDIPILEPDLILDESPISEGPGTVIGRYKLLEKIGEGGMAVVYMAEQTEPIRRKVALKIIKLGMDTKSVIARFEAERQALALMDHPNIAKVLDAGATETGRPYFVMELVTGVSITEYCDKNNLNTKDRLALFIQVCNAVQHAHQKGIIHRDIKPTNVMVEHHDGKPVPKVIDFGIAKATNQRLTEKTLFTRYAHIIGTPAYMSPEQADLSDLDVDTRSDIYSLGVLLYELLTGTTPFSEEELRNAGYLEMQRVICEQEPAKPSTKLSTLGETLTDIAKHRACTPDLLTKTIRGDLDWIVMQCLEKVRTRRYETANALAMDIEHHLNSEPVTARPLSPVYRIEKFMLRNKVALTVGVIITTILILGICLSTWQAVRAAQAEEKAEKARMEEAVQRLLAEEAKITAQRQHYSASIALARNLIEQGQFDRSKQILNQPGLSSLRSWEWGWLERACHRDLMTLDSGGPALTGVDFSPDGRLLATGCFDGTARLWDIVTGREVRRFNVGKSFVLLLDFSPDGQYLVTPNMDGMVKVWNVATGQMLFILEGHTDWVYCAAFSPDGKTIATSSRDKTVRLWDAGDGTSRGIIGEYGDSVMCVAFSPDGRKLAYAGGSGDPSVSSSDTTVRILDLKTGESQVLTGHTDTVTCVVFSPDGKSVATASWDGTSRLGDVGNGSKLLTFFTGPPSSGFWSAAISPDGRLCAVGGGTSSIDAGVYVIDVNTGKIVQAYEGHSRMIRDVEFSPDGTRIVTTSFDGTAKVWLVSPAEFLSLEGHDQAVWAIDVSPDRQWLATGSLDQTAKIWNIESGSLLLTIPVNFPVVSLAFCPDSSRLVTTAADATARVWQLGTEDVRVGRPSLTYKSLLTLAGHSNTVMCVTYSPQGHWIATGSKDNTARIWDAQSGHLIKTLEGHDGWVLDVAFSPDSERLATASADNTARIWQVDTGKLLFELSGNTSQVLQADWDWDKSGSWPSSTPPSTSWILQVTWSPDGKYIAAGGQDGTTCLWDSTSGTLLAPPLQGHRDGVSSLAFSPDGLRLATAGGGTHVHQKFGRDHSVNLWDVTTGQNLLRFKAHDNVVRAVAFDSEGTRLITGSVDNTARVRKAFAWRMTDYPGDPNLSLEQRLELYKSRYWSQAYAGSNVVSQAERQIVERVDGQYNIAIDRVAKTRPLRSVPTRDLAAEPNQIDLTEVYNASIDEAWQPTESLEGLGQDLMAFPAGLRKWDDVLFDARGVIQLCSSHPDWSKFPQSIEIPVNRRFYRLHVLHGVAYVEREGVSVGAFQLIYSDGQRREIEIQYGRDVRDWWVSRDSKLNVEHGTVAWTARRLSASLATEKVRIFLTTYENPRPEIDVVHVNFISKKTQSAPFLLAMTIE